MHVRLGRRDVVGWSSGGGDVGSGSEIALRCFAPHILCTTFSFCLVSPSIVPNSVFPWKTLNELWFAALCCCWQSALVQYNPTEH